MPTPVSIHMPLLQTSLSTNFQSYLTFHPDHWPTGHAICHCPWIHIYFKFRLLLFPYKMDDQVHYSTLYPLEDLPFPLSFKATSEGTVEKPLSISSLHLHSEWTHLQSKPRLFSPPSVGHAQSPIQLCVWAEEGHWSDSGRYHVSGVLFMQLSCALWSCLCSVLDVAPFKIMDCLSYDLVDRPQLMMGCFTAWSLGDHWQAFCLY